MDTSWQHGSQEDTILDQTLRDPVATQEKRDEVQDAHCITKAVVRDTNSPVTNNNEREADNTNRFSHVKEISGNGSKGNAKEQESHIVGLPKGLCDSSDELKHEDFEMTVSQMESLNFVIGSDSGVPCSVPVALDTGDTCVHVNTSVRDDTRPAKESEGSSLSEDSSSDSDDSSSINLASVLGEDDVEDSFADGLDKGKKLSPIKTQDEILIDELPEVEDEEVVLPEDCELRPVGVISSIVEQLVVIKSLKDTPPLKDDSFIFNKDRLAVGKVFEIFGPVFHPYYVLRFNSPSHITEKNLKLQEMVYFAPSLKDYTKLVFADELKLMKGSDASWRNDQEPPPEALDFSDDEQESLAKKKKKKKPNLQRGDGQNGCGSEMGRPRSTHQPFQQAHRPPRHELQPEWGFQSHQEASVPQEHFPSQPVPPMPPPYLPPRDQAFPFHYPHETQYYPQYPFFHPPPMGMPWPPPQFQGTGFYPFPPPPPPPSGPPQ